MGSEGIAVGMATKIPPHNLTEICSALISMIENGSAEQSEETVSKIKAIAALPKQEELISQIAETDPALLAGTFDTISTIDDIVTHVNGPDFPTGGIIYDFKEITNAYRTGKGRVVTRAKAEIIESKKGGFQIIVTELPYQVNKARLLMKIADLARDKKIVGIKDLNDDSDRTGMQITIELKRDARPKVVLNKLFKYSELQTSFPVNMVALNSEGTPQLMNIRQMLMEFLAHRQTIIVRRAQHDLVEAGKRAHILEGLLIALKNLDDVIATIRASADSNVAKDALMTKFGLSEIQSLAILDMQLKRLAALERQKIEDEYNAIQATIGDLISLLQDPKRIIKVIADETLGLIVQYGDERRTKLIKGKIGEFSEEDLIPNEPAVITLTETGYIKRLSPSAFRSQSRGGKGSVGLKMKDEDVVLTLLSANTHDMVLLFTNFGRVFKLKVYEIPAVSRQAKGTAVVNLVNLKPEETVKSLLVIDEAADKDKFISLATRNGLIKKTAVSLFDNIRQNGIIAITLNEGDELVWGKLTSGDDDILLITHSGKCIRFSEQEVKSSQRDTKGVKGITLKSDDYVVGVEAVGEAEINSHLLVITEFGMGKRTELTQYPAQKRSGLGVKVSDVTKRTGPIAAARLVDASCKEIVISTKEGQTIKLPLTKKSIPVLTRPTQGVILMRLKKTDRIVAVALTFKELEDSPEESE